MSNWETCSFEHAPVQIIDGDRGKNYPKQGEFSSRGDCLFLNAGNVTEHGFDFSRCAFITTEKDKALGKGKLFRKDVILTTRGTVGNVAFYNHNAPYDSVRINSGMVIFRADDQKMLPEYLYTFLRSKLFMDQVASLITGSAQPQLPIRDIRRIDIPIPPLPEQRAIGTILGALDDKIELNRQMNQTLEAIAQAIFKSWFVDFDPVKAKAEDREPAGLAREIAVLFPDRFVVTEMGPIPQGWKAASLGEVINIFDSKRVPLSNRQRAERQGQYPYYGAASVMDYVDDYLFDGVYVLVGEDGSVITNENQPVVQYVWGKFWANNHAHVLQGTNGISAEHLNLILNNINILPFITGAVQPKLNQGNMVQIPFVLAPTEINKRFQDTIEDFYSYYRANCEQVGTLENIRDTLLPKLLSGEIRIKDAEKFVEAYL